MELKKKNTELLHSLVSIIDESRKRVAVSINSELTILYWNIGKLINEEILKNERAEYGKQIINEVSKELTERYGTGFSRTNIHNFLKFNEILPDIEIVHSLRGQLTWTHIRELIYVSDELKREFYIQMCIHERWSVRTLQERMNTMLYERTAISKKPEETIKQEIKLLKEDKKLSPDLVFRDPYILDFLGLKDTFSEKDLESAILQNLQSFITEIGTEFAFLARQKRIIIDNEDHYIDLLFYHRGFKSLVAIDLKLEKFKAKHKGQMELYLRWLEHNEQREGENKPIGLILCTEKSPEQIKYMMIDEDEQIKVAEYAVKLLPKEILQQKLDKAIELAEYSLTHKR
ncbi:MAG: DUF1016 domain-containing protein [Porphyromonadaceae bacterium]|nr:DUF1016 domain-containing protein [Porphyromonadaceae bacterium]